MHQSHNIPWDIISSNFKFVQEDKSFTPAYTGLVSRNKPNFNQELAHFTRKFSKAVAVFSETERAKYPKNIPPPQSGRLFSDELREKYPCCLNERNQRLEHWIKQARRRGPAQDGSPSPPSYPNDDQLADVVNVLLFENQMEVLLMLAQHPDVPLHHLNPGQYSSISLMKHSALEAYLFFNCADATNTLDNGQYTLSSSYTAVFGHITSCIDSAHQIAHRNFLMACGLLDANGHLDANDYYVPKYDDCARVWAKNFHVHGDYGLMKGYMKTLFALVYRYDVIMRECGLDPEWDREVGLYLNRTRPILYC